MEQQHFLPCALHYHTGCELVLSIPFCFSRFVHIHLGVLSLKSLFSLLVYIYPSTPSPSDWLNEYFVGSCRVLNNPIKYEALWKNKRP